ncbi:hypothetical protein DPMN_142032 [Dreissena polymorpha]|uniref:Uncharacterized protein n=1 Tax=Dreissena polymorpha TaxID=45954 RepID=A0A9D4GAD9_DREPO|nr:hypothetical protein DPMN_142032 [Dreissena polymorpha]
MEVTRVLICVALSLVLLADAGIFFANPQSQRTEGIADLGSAYQPRGYATQPS